jgi:hypothetical protein
MGIAVLMKNTQRRGLKRAMRSFKKKERRKREPWLRLPLVRPFFFLWYYKSGSMHAWALIWLDSIAIARKGSSRAC